MKCPRCCENLIPVYRHVTPRSGNPDEWHCDLCKVAWEIKLVSVDYDASEDIFEEFRGKLVKTY